MAYFDFNYVTNPPADELVDEDPQLNDNWIELGTKLAGWNQNPSNIIAPIPVGTESVRSDTELSIWDGFTWILADEEDAYESGWQSLSLRSPAVARADFPPKFMVNTHKRWIRFQGGVSFNAAADPWPTGSNVEITADAAIAASFAPQPGSLSHTQIAGSQIVAAGGFAGAVAMVSVKAGPSRVAIDIRYQGDAGGGNFIVLDGLEWYY